MIVTYNKPGVLNVGGIILLGGANQVPADKWKPHIKNPVIKALVDEGHLEFDMHGDEDGKPPVDADGLDEKHLATLKAKEALELVGATVNADLLKVWAKNETRVTVKAKIDEQLKALAAPAVHRNEGGADAPVSAATGNAGAREELKPIEGND